MTELPAGWVTKSLNSIVDVLDNQRVPINSKERAKRVGSVPYYGATGQVGTIDKAIFNEDLLLLGEDGVQFFDPYKHKAYKISGPAWVNNHAHVLRPKEEEEELRFLLHYLNQFNYNGYANGTTRLKLTQGSMNSIPVSLPPLTEQQKIVEILEDNLSRLDAALADVKQAKEKAAHFRRSLLQAAFTGNLASDGTHLMTELPDGWVSKTIGDIASFNRKKPQVKKNSKELVSFVPMPKVYETLNRITLDESISHMQGQKRSLTYFEDGDIIFAKITPCMENGKIAIAKFLLNGSAYGSTEFHVLTAGPEVLAEYLFYFVVSDDFRANAAAAMTGAVGQRRVPKSYLENHLIPLPPLPVQQKIVEILEDHLSRLDVSVVLADAMEKQSASLRRALLQAAFTGQLTKEVASV